MYFFEAGLPASKSRENDFIVAAPSSHVQGLRSSKSMAAFSGNAKKRSLFAPSDQNGALIVYGIRPGTGLCSLTEVNKPVLLSLRGNGGNFVCGGVRSSCAM